MPPVAVAEFQNALVELAARSGEAAAQLVSRLDRLSRTEALAFITDAYPALLEPFLRASGDMTAQWYAEQPAAPVKPGQPEFVPELAALPAAEQLAISGRWALLQADPVVAITGNATRQTMGSSRRTVIDNAEREGVRWVRRALPSACGFCRMLATRTAQQGKTTIYRTKESAERVVGRRGVARGNRALGSKYHDHCKCVAVMVRDGSVYVPEYTQRWKKDYEQALKDGARTPAQIANAMDKRPSRPSGKKKPIVNAGQPAVVQLDSPIGVTGRAAAELDQATTVQEIGDIMSRVHGIDVDKLINSEMERGYNAGGYVVGPRYVTLEIARQFAQAVDDIMTKYPFLTLDEMRAEWYPVVDNPMMSSAHAQYHVVDGKIKPHYVALCRDTDPKNGEGSAISMARDANRSDGYDAKFKSAPVMVERPIYATIIHEMGHIMDFFGGNKARAYALQAIKKYFVTEVPEGTKIAGKLGRDWDLEPEGFAAWTTWLEDKLVSAYSYNDSNRSRGINIAEALAEAFRDVELRGDQAEPLSKIMHEAMLKAAREQIPAP